MRPICPPLPPIPDAMDWEHFRKEGHKMIDYIADYYQSLKTRSVPVQANVDPGYLRKLIPEETAPEKPSGEFDSIMRDIHTKIMPGMTNWQHPDFYAFFPAQISPAALLGDTIANAVNQPGFNWIASPAASELEVIVTDWLARAFGLPESMLWSSTGGGVLQPSASEAAVVAMLAAKNRALAPFVTIEEKAVASGKLVTYVSDQAHFCIEKAARILCIYHLRKVKTRRMPDGNCPMIGEDAAAAVEADIKAGLIPLFLSFNYGTTGVCATDDFEGIIPVCKKHGIWLHLDAAYAGATAVCPEMRAPLLPAFNSVDSLFINGSKWFSTMFNGTFFFFTERKHIAASLNATGVYLSNKHTDANAVVDFKDYHLGMGRPFRALKIFTNLRYMGLEGIQSTVRRHCALAQYLEQLLKTQDEGMFEYPIAAKFGLVCFRFKNDPDNARTKALLATMDQERKIFVVHHELDGKVLVRVALAWPGLTEKDMEELSSYLVATAKTVQPTV